MRGCFTYRVLRGSVPVFLFWMVWGVVLCQGCQLEEGVSWFLIGVLAEAVYSELVACVFAGVPIFEELLDDLTKRKPFLTIYFLGGIINI